MVGNKAKYFSFVFNLTKSNFQDAANMMQNQDEFEQQTPAHMNNVVQNIMEPSNGYGHGMQADQAGQTRRSTRPKRQVQPYNTAKTRCVVCRKVIMFEFAFVGDGTQVCSVECGGHQ